MEQDPPLDLAAKIVSALMVDADGRVGSRLEIKAQVNMGSGPPVEIPIASWSTETLVNLITYILKENLS